MVLVRSDKDDRHAAATATGAIATGAIAAATGTTSAGTITGTLSTIRVMLTDFSVHMIMFGGRGGGERDNGRGALREVENAQQQLHGAGRARAGEQHHVVLAAPDTLRDQLPRLGSARESVQHAGVR